MSKKRGIDVEGRRMLYEPWPLEGGPYRDRYAVSGSAVRETLLYFEECGGDTSRLVDLLNSHVVDDRYLTSRDELLDGARWYTNEYYFYFIMFTKKVIGRYDFHYGENDPDGSNTPLSEHHRIYELGIMRKRPWGLDEDGREIRDVTMSNLIAVTYLFSSNPRLVEDFTRFLNDCLLEGYSLDTSILEKQLLWCSLQFVEYGFEFAKVCMPPEIPIADSVFSSVLKTIHLANLFRTIPHTIRLKFIRNMFDSTNKVHNTDYSIIDDKELSIEGRVVNIHESNSKYDRYLLSCQKNDANVWLGAVAGLVAITNNSLFFPEYQLHLQKDGYGFQITFVLTPSDDRKKDVLVAALVMSGIAIPSLALSLLFGKPASCTFLVVCIATISLLIVRDRRSRKEIRRVLKDATDQAGVSVNQIEELAATTAELMKERTLLETKVQERTAELEEANRKLRDLDVAKTNFFANISHELRTPIALIRAPLESIIGGEYGVSINRGHRLFSVMRRNTLRLARLVDDLLSVVKIERGGMRLSPEPLDASATVRNYVSEFESAARLKGIRLIFVEPNVPRFAIHADPRGFETIFLNLMSNALKYTGSGGSITVTVSADKAAGSCSVTVRDTGIGIPESKQDLVFERFKRIYDDERNSYEGCGIGLSLSREIARLHGGDISFTSAEGAGSSFTLVLPLADSSVRKEARGVTASALIKDRLVAEDFGTATTETAKDIKPTRERGRPLQRILLVEDNRDLVEFLAASLGDVYETARAYDGNEALALLGRGPLPDLIVSDIMMPGMDGIELFRRTREDGRLACIPFVFLTARATEEERLERLAKGAVEYLYKPFSVEELRARIKAVLSIRETDKSDMERRVLIALRGDRYPASAAGDLISRFDLSPREREVARLLLDGKSDKEIAALLDLSTKTVSHHISSIYRKTGTDGRMGFMRLCMQG